MHFSCYDFQFSNYLQLPISDRSHLLVLNSFKTNSNNIYRLQVTRHPSAELIWVPRPNATTRFQQCEHPLTRPLRRGL